MINFTPKTPVRFTADIVVTPSLDRLPDYDVIRFREDIPSLRPGSYRIGFFGDGRDRWWRLADDTADPHGIGTVRSRHPRDWYAPSYSVPLPEIMQQAAVDFSDAFARDVIPRLSRQTTSPS